MLKFSDSHKAHLNFLKTLPENVLADFCKLSWDYLFRGPNLKLYNSASQKLNVAAQDIQHVVEALTNLLVEACKLKISSPKLTEYLTEFGFNESLSEVLCTFYRTKQSDISQVLLAATIQLPTFKDLEWRVEAQVGSRALPNQITPKILMKLSLEGQGEGKPSGILLETDPGNLLHITQVLEKALREANSLHTRRVQRRFKPS